MSKWSKKYTICFFLFAQDINFGATVSAGVFGTLSVVAGVIGVVGFRKIRSLRSDTLILRSKLAGAVDAHSKISSSCI